MSPFSYDTFAHGVYYKKSPLMSITDLKGVFFTPLLIPFFALGIILPAFSKRKEDMILLFTFYILLLAISLCAEKTLRYTLLITPFCLLLTGRGLQFFIHFIFKNKCILLRKINLGIILGLLVFAAQILPFQLYKLYDLAQSFTGLKEASHWIKRHVDSNTMILASSVRQVQYYSGIKQAEFGGPLYYFSPRLDDFLKIVTQNHGPIFLVLDSWEPRQPLFLNNPKTSEFLKKLGFHEERRWGPYKDLSGIPRYVVVFSRPGFKQNKEVAPNEK